MAQEPPIISWMRELPFLNGAVEFLAGSVPASGVTPGLRNMRQAASPPSIVSFGFGVTGDVPLLGLLDQQRADQTD